MKGKRISREAALRIGAVVLAVAASVAVLPGLLAAPEPPPLAADIGLGASGATGVIGPMKAEGGSGREKRPERTRGERGREPGAGVSDPQPTATLRDRRREPREEHEKDRSPERPDDGAPAQVSAPPPAVIAPAPPVAVAPPPSPPAPPPPPAPGEFGP